MASLSGTSGNDLLNGTADKDTISGLGGDDTIHGLEGNDSLNGGSGADLLYGDDGNDVLNGGIGIDTMRGGAGDDTYVVDDAGDLAIEGSSAGLDLVKASVTWKLISNLENLTLTGTAAIDGTGNSLANILTGNSASNILNGLGGADKMKGGGGDDTYIVDNVGDVLVEGTTGGTDLVKSSVSWKLGSNLENLILTASAANGTGNGLDNHITGNSAANILNGMAGADTMSGGAGDDTYVVDNPGDLVTEASATGGTDLVKSSVSFALGARLENLTLTGTAAIDGTGNSLDNVIVGNNSANVIDGGAGADKMTGRSGDDIYFVDNVGDRAIETSASGGIDLVESSVSFTLGANVENLTLSGDLAINGGGNALANIISGNAAANVIDGGAGDDTLNGGGGNDTIDGGTGGDAMIGGPGDDTYFVDNLADALTENSNEGTDFAWVAVDTFNGAENVENLSVSPDYTGDVTLHGNGLVNSLTGGVGNDTIFGAFGADTIVGGDGDDTIFGEQGADVLTGGAGADAFRFNTEQSSTLIWGIDQVTDFVSGTDKLDFRGVTGLLTLRGDPTAHTLWIHNLTQNPDGSFDYIFRGDTDGNTMTVEMEIHVHADGLTSSDFLFG